MAKAHSKRRNYGAATPPQPSHKALWLLLCAFVVCLWAMDLFFKIKNAIAHKQKHCTGAFLVFRFLFKNAPVQPCLFYFVLFFFPAFFVLYILCIDRVF